MLEQIKVIFGIVGSDLDRYIVIGLMFISLFLTIILLNMLVRIIDVILNRE